jgi:hypothetical protein
MIKTRNHLNVINTILIAKESINIYSLTCMTEYTVAMMCSIINYAYEEWNDFFS